MPERDVADIQEMSKTASFVLTIRQVVWIRDEAKRRGLNMSEFMREVIDQSMADAVASDTEAAA